MKDEIVTCVILLMLTGLFVCNSIVVKRCSRDVTKAVTYAEEAVLNDTDAHMAIKNACNTWNKRKKFLFYITDHELILQIDEKMKLSYEYLEMSDTKRSVASLKMVRIMLEDLAGREKIRLDNIV